MIHIREPYIPSHQLAPELPREVVWLRRATVVLIGILIAGFLALALRAFMLAPWFSMTRMTVTGSTSYDTQFHSALTLRANVLPTLTGNYFNVNLQAVRERFEALPWIRAASVQRVFPNSLIVTLTAHVPVARYGEPTNDTGVERLVNSQGEIFEASGGQIDTDDLPLLTGTPTEAARVLALYTNLQTALQSSLPNQTVTELAHTRQGLWLAKLSGGATLQLGAGHAADVMQRFVRFQKMLPEVAQKYNTSALQSLDLRYADGFAMRLAGVTTRQGN